MMINNNHTENFPQKKFLFISDESLSGDLAWQIKKEGHEVKVFIKSEDDKDVYDGILEKVNSWEEWKDWAEIIIFDDVGFGEIADELRKQGKSVYLIPGDVKMKKSLAIADKLNANFINILDPIEMKDNKYIGDFKEYLGRGGYIKINLLGKINKCGSIKPRFSIKKNEIEKYEKRYLPAKDFGIIIISTNKGLTTHHQAKEKGFGGRLISYIY